MATQSIIVFLISSFFLLEILISSVYGDSENLTRFEGFEYIVVCSQPLDYGGAPIDRIRFSFDTDAEECVEFTWTSCGGNKNNFYSQSECEKHCSGLSNEDPEYINTCSKIQDVGQPEGIEQSRYYYNPLTEVCEHFTYDGCAGNDNNFENQNDCNTFCRVNA